MGPFDMRETGIAIRSREGLPSEAILLTIDFKEHSGQWLAECLELGTTTYADSLEEVRREIRDNITLQLGSVEDLGFMDGYLRERNVSLIPLAAPPGNQGQAATWTSPEPMSV